MVTLKFHRLQADIDPMGAELIALYKDGKNMLWCRDPAIWGESAPLLFPICGRLRGNTYTHGGKTYELPPHGFAKSSRFSVCEQSESHAVLELTSNDESVKFYPFTFALRVIYELTQAGLLATFEVENLGEQTMYYSLGGHWGFALEQTLDAYSLRFDQPVTLSREILDGAFLADRQETVLTDCDTLKLDYRICDNDTYVFKNAPAACTLMQGDKPIVRLEYPDTPHLLLWTQPGQKYLCIEPWNGLPDHEKSTALADKESIRTLAPGKRDQLQHRILF